MSTKNTGRTLRYILDVAVSKADEMEKIIEAWGDMIKVVDFQTANSGRKPQKVGAQRKPRKDPTEAERIAIYKSASRMGNQEVAKKFNVSPSTVSRIRNAVDPRTKELIREGKITPRKE